MPKPSLLNKFSALSLSFNAILLITYTSSNADARALPAPSGCEVTWDINQNPVALALNRSLAGGKLIWTGECSDTQEGPKGLGKYAIQATSGKISNQTYCIFSWGPGNKYEISKTYSCENYLSALAGRQDVKNDRGKWVIIEKLLINRTNATHKCENSRNCNNTETAQKSLKGLPGSWSNNHASF